MAENLRLGVQVRHPRRFALLIRADRLADVERETAALIGFLGLGGLEEVPAENPLGPCNWSSGHPMGRVRTAASDDLRRRAAKASARPMAGQPTIRED